MAERARELAPLRRRPSRVLVAGATGFAGALAAHLLWRHPALRAGGRRPSRSDAGPARWTTLYPRHRVPLVLEELDLDGSHGDVDAAIVAYPHGAGAPVVAALRERGAKVVDLSRRLPPARPGDLRALVRRASAPRAARRRRLRPARAATATQIARRALVANPGCYPTASMLGARAARAGRADRRRRDRRQVGRLRRRARGHRRRRTSWPSTRTSRPTGSPTHRHTPEIEQQLAVLGADVVTAFTPHLVPLDQGELATCYVTPSRGDAGRAARALRGRLRGRAVRRDRRAAAAACATCARRTSAASSRRRRAHRQGARVLGDRQPLEGHRPRRRSRT